jgi:hypothetical protein
MFAAELPLGVKQHLLDLKLDLLNIIGARFGNAILDDACGQEHMPATIECDLGLIAIRTATTRQE